MKRLSETPDAPTPRSFSLITAHRSPVQDPQTQSLKVTLTCQSVFFDSPALNVEQMGCKTALIRSGVWVVFAEFGETGVVDAQENNKLLSSFFSCPSLTFYFSFSYTLES